MAWDCSVYKFAMAGPDDVSGLENLLYAALAGNPHPNGFGFPAGAGQFHEILKICRIMFFDQQHRRP
jgi:hypothetical protein